MCGFEDGDHGALSQGRESSPAAFQRHKKGSRNKKKLTGEKESRSVFVVKGYGMV
jgi:hypothetical protein